MKMRKFMAVFVTFVMLFNFVPPPQQAEAFISDPTDLGYLSTGDPVDVNGTERSFHGYWDITVNDANGSELGSAKDMAIAHDFRPSAGESGDIYNYVADSVIDDWIDLLKGNQGYVNDHYNNQKVVTLSANSRNSERIHVRDLADVCGAWVSDFDANAKEVTIYTTPLPSARISYDGSTKEGDTETFRLYGSGYVAGDKGISEWEFKIDGARVDKGGSTSRLAESVTNTFSSTGTYTATLEVTDNVGRSSSDSVTITVGSGTQPPAPPPEPPSGGPDASFDMPFSTNVGDSVSIENTSSASTGHTIVDTDWDVEGFYSGTLGTEGGSITFNSTGTYDVTLTVEDDQGKTDSTTKTIIVEEQPPPPPPPNEEPTAEFDMPSHAKQGDTVDVENLSNDDGTIVDVDWEIDPTTGVTDNLGDSGGTITFAETGTYTVTLTVEDDDGATDSEVDSIEVSNEPPEAEIDMPDVVIQGQDLTIECDSSDPDSTIASRSWSVSPEGMIGTLDGQESTVYFDKAQDYTIELTVEDEYGKTDTATKNITIKPAIPEAYYEWNGTPKVNRKVVFDASGSQSSDRYPIIWDQTQWEFVTPAGATQNDVKVVNTGDLSERKVVFKEPGDYTVRIAVKNTAGYTSDWYEKTVTVSEDKPPKADFKVTSAVLREPENNNKAKIELFGNSYSPDGDTISERKWTYKYDTDNDGSFSDETEKVLDDGNNSTPVLYTSEVGKYKFELSIKEAFGQPTISQFVTEEDRFSDDTSDMPLNDKKVEVLNRQPVVNFDPIDKKKADIVFTIGKVDENKIDDLSGDINKYLKTKLGNCNIDYGTIEAIDTSTFSSNSAAAEVIFNSWDRYGVGTTNTWHYDSSTKVIKRENNDFWSGFYNPNFNSSQYTLEVDMTSLHGDNDDIGITFGMGSDPKGSYAYLLSGESGRNFSTGTIDTERHGHATGLYQYNGSSIKGIKGNDNLEFTPNEWTHFKLKVDGKHAQIWLDGQKVIDFTAPRELKGSYGFFTNSQPEGAFKNLVVTSGSTKSLDEILRMPDWRDHAQHFIINISDVEYPALDDPEKSSIIYSRLLNNKIHYCVMGTDKNKDQTQEVIDNNEDRGTFEYNNNMPNGLSNIADYIVNQVNSEQGGKVKYVLKGQEIEYNTYYKDKENDPEIERRWRYSHNPNYYDNSLGTASYDEQFIPAPVTTFNKTGKFETVFQAKDNPKDDDRFSEYREWSYMPQDKLNIYVHRRPKALYSCTLNIDKETYNYQDNNIDYSGEDGSYAYWNPQFNAPSGEKIKTIEFKTPEANDDEWRNNLLIKGYKNGSWQTIKDYESSYEWSSNPVSDTINVSGQGYTKVKFNFSMYDSAGSAYGSPDNSYYKITTEKTINSGVQYNDYSYDPDHQTEGDKGIVQHEWMWKEIGSYSYSTDSYQESNIDFSDEDGDYAHWSPQFKAPDGETIKTIEFKTPRADDDEWRNNLYVKGYYNGSWQTIKDYKSSHEWDSDPVSDTIDVSGQEYTKVKFKFTMYDSADSAYGDPDDSYYKITTEKKITNTAVTDWNSGKLNNVEEGKIYLVSLRVKDEEGVWSYRNSQVLNAINDNMKPIAQFEVSPNPVIQGQDVQYKDNSYDPDGDTLVARQWRVKKEPDGSWSACSSPPTTYDEPGDYKIELKVRDQSSETTEKNYPEQNIDFSDEDGHYAYWKPQFNANNGETIKTIEFKSPEAPDDEWRGDLLVQGYKNGSWHTIKNYESSYEWDSRSISDTLDVSGQGYTKAKCNFGMYDSAGSAYGDPDSSYFNITTEKQSQSWSDPFYQTLHVKPGNAKPVANFTVSPNPAPVDDDLSYTDQSSDPNGDPIVDESWRWRKSGSSEWHYGKPFSPKDLVTKIKRADEIAQGELSGYGPVGNVISIQENKESTLITFHSSPHVEGQLAEQNAEIITLSFEGSEVNVQSGFFTTNASANSGANQGGWDGIQIEGRPESITFTDGSSLNLFVNNQLYATGTNITYHPTGTYVDQNIELGDYQIAKRVKDMPALTTMNALWSSWHEETLKVVKENEKPVAQFSVTPDPTATDNAVTYTDNSYDPDGIGITERVWRVETSSGTLLGEYTNSEPPSVFANTGWGDNGAGDYRIGLKVKDAAPNAYATAKWSDWTWHDLKVIIPLEGSGEITPDPAPSGYNVDITVDTEGYAEEVVVKFPNDSYFNGDEVTLTPENSISNKFNTFKGNYKTDLETPDGTYNVTATIKRINTAPQTINIPLTAAIQGNIYDQVKVRKKDTS